MSRDSQHVVAMVLIIYTIAVVAWSLWVSRPHRSGRPRKPESQPTAWQVPHERERHGVRPRFGWGDK